MKIESKAAVFLLVGFLAIFTSGQIDYSVHGQNWGDVCATGTQQAPMAVGTTVTFTYNT